MRQGGQMLEAIEALRKARIRMNSLSRGSSNEAAAQEVSRLVAQAEVKANEVLEVRMNYAKVYVSYTEPSDRLIEMIPTRHDEATRQQAFAGWLAINEYYHKGTDMLDILREGIRQYNAAAEGLRASGENAAVGRQLQAVLAIANRLEPMLLSLFAVEGELSACYSEATSALTNLNETSFTQSLESSRRVMMVGFALVLLAGVEMLVLQEILAREWGAV